MLDDPDEVVQMNPRHPLPSIAEHRCAAEAGCERQRLQYPAFLTEHESDPQSAYPHLQGFRPNCGGLPLLTKLGQKARALAAVLLQELAAALAVEADRGCIYQHGRFVS